MTDPGLEQQLEQMLARYAGRPVDTAASWRRLTRLRLQATRSRNRRLTAAGVIAAVALVAAAAPAVAHQLSGARGDSGLQRPAPGGHQVRRSADRRIAITARIAVPGAGSTPGDTSMAAVVVGQRGQLWTLTYSADLLRIDPATNRVTLRVHMPGARDLAAGSAALWVLSRAGGSAGPDGQLVRIDPASGRIVTRFPLSRQCGQVTYAGAQLWLACGSRATVFVRLDPVTGRVLATRGPVYGVSSVTATPYGIWYSGNSGVRGFVGTGTRLHWVSARDRSVPTSLVDTNSLVYGQRALWAYSDTESVAKIDPATGQIVRIYSSDAYDRAAAMSLDFFAVGLNSLWFLNDDHYEATSVLRVSLTTGRPQGRVYGVGSCGEPCWQIYFTQGSAWIPTRADIIRISPVRRTNRG